MCPCSGFASQRRVSLARVVLPLTATAPGHTWSRRRQQDEARVMEPYSAALFRLRGSLWWRGTPGSDLIAARSPVDYCLRATERAARPPSRLSAHKDGADAVARGRPPPCVSDARGHPRARCWHAGAAGAAAHPLHSGTGFPRSPPGVLLRDGPQALCSPPLNGRETLASPLGKLAGRRAQAATVSTSSATATSTASATSSAVGLSLSVALAGGHALHRWRRQPGPGAHLRISPCAATTRVPPPHHSHYTKGIMLRRSARQTLAARMLRAPAA
jgi:hypothetical protein